LFTNSDIGQLLQHIQRKPGLNTAALAEQSDTPKRTIERWLKQLKAQGLVEFRGAPKTGGYHAKVLTQQSQIAP
jgi:ATP-dependent DNA helicase RecG